MSLSGNASISNHSLPKTAGSAEAETFLKVFSLSLSFLDLCLRRRVCSAASILPSQRYNSVLLSLAFGTHIWKSINALTIVKPSKIPMYSSCDFWAELNCLLVHLFFSYALIFSLLSLVASYHLFRSLTCKSIGIILLITRTDAILSAVLRASSPAFFTCPYSFMVESCVFPAYFSFICL